MTLDDAMTTLRRASKRLAVDQGKRARRNARTAMLTALRQVRAALDEHYPAIVERKARVSLSDRATKMRFKRWRAQHVPIGTDVAAAYMAIGIPVVVREQPDRLGTYWIPRWVQDLVAARTKPATIASCVRQVQKRKRLLAMAKLGMTLGDRS